MAGRAGGSNEDETATGDNDRGGSAVGMLMHDICPYRIGSRVRVSPSNKFAAEWPGNYAVTGIRWDYQKGDGTSINISIASDLEIQAKHGDTDGWNPDDLIPA